MQQDAACALPASLQQPAACRSLPWPLLQSAAGCSSLSTLADAGCRLLASRLQGAPCCIQMLQQQPSSGRGKKLVLQAHSGGRATAAAGCGLLQVTGRRLQPA